MKVVPSQECMDSTMNVKEDIVCHSGETFAQCLITFRFLQSSMRESCACMVDYHLSWILLPKLILLLDLKMSQMKDCYVICFGQILMIIQVGAPMNVVFLLFLDRIL